MLDRLAARDLTKQLPRRPGQKESRWAQLLTGDDVVDSVPAAPVMAGVIAPPSAAVAEPAPPEPDRAPPAPHSLDIQDPTIETVIIFVSLTTAALVVVAPVEVFKNMSWEFAGRPKQSAVTVLPVWDM